jgi:hypothetical protein
VRRRRRPSPSAGTSPCCDVSHETRRVAHATCCSSASRVASTSRTRASVGDATGV